MLRSGLTWEVGNLWLRGSYYNFLYFRGAVNTTVKEPSHDAAFKICSDVSTHQIIKVCHGAETVAASL